MKFFLVSLALLTLAACGPREDERINQGGGAGAAGVQLKSGQVLETSKQGEMPETCPGDAKAWNTIRLFPELSFIFDRLDELKVVVAKGDFNCLKVSDQEAVQIVTGQGDGKYKDSGVFYHVEKILIQRADDFLGDSKLFKKMAQDMAMSEAQLRAFLNDRPKQNVNITFLKPADPDAIQNNKGPSLKIDSGLKYGSIEGVEGTKLPSCSAEGDPIWNIIELDNALVPEAADLASIRTVVGKKTRHCLQVSTKSTVELKIQSSVDAKEFTSTGEHFKVLGLEMFNRQDFIKNKALVAEAAAGALIEPATLLSYLNEEPLADFVTLSYIESSEPIVGAKLTPVTVFKGVGTQASECKSPWGEIRVDLELQNQIQQSIDQQKVTSFLRSGDLNCYVIGNTVNLAFQNTEGKYQVDSSLQVKILSVTRRGKADFDRDPIFSEIVAEQAGLSLESLTALLADFKDTITVTRVQWVEAVQ